MSLRTEKILSLDKFIPAGFTLENTNFSKDGDLVILSATMPDPDDKNKDKSKRERIWKYGVYSVEKGKLVLSFGGERINSFMGKYVFLQGSAYNIENGKYVNGIPMALQGSDWFMVFDRDNNMQHLMDSVSGHQLHSSCSFEPKVWGDDLVSVRDPDRGVRTFSYPNGKEIKELSASGGYEVVIEDNRGRKDVVGDRFGIISRPKHLRDFTDRIILINGFKTIRENVNVFRIGHGRMLCQFKNGLVEMLSPNAEVMKTREGVKKCVLNKHSNSQYGEDYMLEPRGHANFYKETVIFVQGEKIEVIDPNSETPMKTLATITGKNAKSINNVFAFQKYSLVLKVQLAGSKKYQIVGKGGDPLSCIFDEILAHGKDFWKVRAGNEIKIIYMEKANIK
jgi:hypothetical protein